MYSMLLICYYLYFKNNDKIMIMIIQNHNELSYNFENPTYDDIMLIVSKLIDFNNWTRMIRKKDRQNMDVLLDINNKSFICNFLCVVNNTDNTKIYCKNSYERLLCYKLSMILNLECKKELIDDSKYLCCKIGQECICDELESMGAKFKYQDYNENRHYKLYRHKINGVIIRKKSNIN